MFVQGIYFANIYLLVEDIDLLLREISRKGISKAK